MWRGTKTLTTGETSSVIVNKKSRNLPEVGRKMRLGNVTQEMFPMNGNEEGEEKERVRQPSMPMFPKRLIISEMPLSQLKDILEKDRVSPYARLGTV